MPRPDNYLVEVDLKQKTDLADGENYKMTLWNSKMLKLKDQAFYSTNKNDTFFLFGGRTLGGAPNDDGIWEYSTGSKQWSRQETGVRPGAFLFSLFFSPFYLPYMESGS